MGFFLMLAAMVVSYVLQIALRPRPRVQSPQPSSLQDFDLPRAEDGAAISVVSGRCWLKAPVVLAVGSFRSVPIKQDGVTIGFKYYMVLQLGLCLGQLDELLDVRFDERPLPGSTITIDADHNRLMFANTPLHTNGDDWFEAEVTPGEYSIPAAAQALTTELIAESGGDTGWKAVPGYHTIVGFTEEISYQVLGVADTGVKVAKVNAGWYASALSMFQEAARAINAKEATISGGARISVVGSSNLVFGNQLTATRIDAAATGWKIIGGGDYTKTVHGTLGFHIAADYSATGFPTPAVITAPYPTAPNRINLIYSGLGGIYNLNAPNNEHAGGGSGVNYSPKTSTILGVLGFFERLIGNNPAVGAIMADEDRVTKGLTITDMGDFWRVVINPGVADPSGVQLVVDNLHSILNEIGGVIDVYKGTETQMPDPYLEAMTGEDLPAYRGIAYASMHGFEGSTLGFHVANQPYIKGVSFLVGRHENQLALTGGDENIGGDRNAAAMIYEALTDPRYAGGKADADIDLTKLRAFGASLADEGFGLSMVADGTSEIDAYVGEILRLVDGVRYEDPTTGKLVFKLIRPDYDVGDLIELTDETADCESFSRPSWGKTRNVVNLRYVDRAADYTFRTAIYQDMASINARGQTVPEEVDYLGISNKEIASRVAYRVGRTIASRPALIRLNAQRIAAELRPGDPVPWSSARLGISGMPCRVIQTSPGDLTKGKVVLELRQDIFGPTWATYTPPGGPPGDWLPPVATGTGGFGTAWGNDLI